MPVYAFQLSSHLAGRAVSVSPAGSATVVASGTLDESAAFSVSLPVGDYVAVAGSGQYAYRAAGTVDQGDPDRLADSALSFIYAAKADRTGISAKAYGATGDGATDDTAAIKAALAAAASFGAETYLPEGTYVISRDGGNTYALSLPAGTKLRGPGKLKMAAGVAVGVRGILIAGAGCSVVGISIDMNRAAQSVDPTRHAIALSNVAQTSIHDVTITGATGDGILVSTGCTDVSIRGIRITDCGRNGISLYSGTAGQQVSNVLIQGCHIEADVQPVDSEPDGGAIRRVRVHGNYLKSVTNDYALTMAGKADDFDTDWSVVGNYMLGALWCVSMSHAQIVGNTIDARATTKNAVHAWFGSDSVTLSANRIYAPADKEGVSLSLSSGQRPTNWTITGNVISVTGTTSARGINLQGCGPTVVSGNIIRGVNGSQGIRAQSTAAMESLTITGNDIDGFAYGIFFTTSAGNFERLTVSNNTVDNSQATPTVTAGIYFTGTSSQFLQTVLAGNLVDPVFTTAYTLGNVLLRTGGADRPAFSGNGTPEAVVTANVGATYLRRDGGAATTFYVKETGTGNTGWVAK